MRRADAELKRYASSIHRAQPFIGQLDEMKIARFGGVSHLKGIADRH
jgi:hypothetical protein